MSKIFKTLILIEFAGLILFVLSGSSGFEDPVPFTNWNGDTTHWIRYVLIDDIILFSPLFVSTILVYYFSKLEFKKKISSKKRWLIILGTFIMPSIIIYQINNYLIENLLAPFFIPSLFLGSFLDSRIFQILYSRSAIYSSDETIYFRIFVIIAAIIYAVIINLLINLSVKKLKK